MKGPILRAVYHIVKRRSLRLCLAALKRIRNLSTLLTYTTAVSLNLDCHRGAPPLLKAAVMRPSLLPGLQVPNPSHPPYRTNLRSPYSPLQSPTPQHEVPITHPILQSSQEVSTESQSNDVLAVGIHEASGRLVMSIDTHQETHTGPVTGGTTPLPMPLELQPVPPSFSPPPFEEHDQLSISCPEIIDTAPVIPRPPAAVSHEPPPEDDPEEVPLYTLVDEELPPPSFDDIQAGTSFTEGPVEQYETLSQETIGARTTPSQSPPQSLPPRTRGPSTNAAENAPVYSHSEEISFAIGRSRNTNEDNRISLPSASTCHSSDRSSSDPLNVVSSTSPPTSPPSAVSHDEIVTPLKVPLPSDSRPPSVSSYPFSDGQFVGTSYDSSAIHRNSPPLLNYRTKPTARQSGQSFLPPPTLRRRNPRSLVSAIGDNTAIDTLTRALSDMMEGPSSARHNFAYENVSSGEQNILRTSFGNDQNIPINLASRPSGTTRIVENYETSRTDDERLAREAYLRPTHAETGGRTGHGTQGSGPANPGVLSSQHLPPTVPPTGLIPPVYSHDKFYAETTRTAGVLHQFGETPAPSSGTSLHSVRSHIAPTQPSPSFPYPLQASHHSISGNARRPGCTC
ncbi:hypothetical protein JVU11DRAFT_1264 [Chiua virens]|nr:hypothetical protein JVU11DRAFT_1264 [Chiua virens]